MTDTQYKSTLYDKLLSLVIHDLSQGLLIRLLLVISIYAGVLIINRLGWDEFRASSLIATILAAIILFITSPSTRSWILNRHITGYWLYSAKSEFGGDEYVKTTVIIPTLVRIYQDGSDLKMIGYHQHSGGERYFVAGEAALTNPSNNSGRFTYWYQSPSSSTGIKSFLV